MRDPVFTGCCPAMVTPFHESGEIDYNSFAKLLEYQISAGVDAVCVCGTTGEVSTLSQSEQESLIRFCVEQVDHRVKVIAGTGSNNTSIAKEKSKAAELAGADALLVVTPYYNKTTQPGLIRHYQAIASVTELPIILYNVPGRTGLSFSAETYAELSQIPNINGVKEASGNMTLFLHAREKCPEDFYFWSGNDDQVVPFMVLGAKGVISAASNIIPEVMVEMTQLCLSNKFEAAAKLQIENSDLIDALFAEVNPIPVKAAMHLFGMCSEYVRPPLCPSSQPALTMLKSALSKAGLY